MRIVLMAVTAPMLLIGGAAMAQQRHPSEDEIACKLARDCGPVQAPASSGQAGDGGVEIEDNERPFCFGGSGCGHAAKPVAATQRAVAPTRPTGAVGNARPPRFGTRNAPRYVPAAATPAPAGRGSLDMALTFRNASADLSPTSRDQIAAFARALTNSRRASLSTMSFNIEGHTNAVGTRETNLDLSQRRAQAVVDYMVSLGVGKDRLVARGLGFDSPLANSKPTDPANRRVEIVAR